MPELVLSYSSRDTRSEPVLCLNCCLTARVINLTTTGLLEAVLEETGGLGVDAILDPTGETPDVRPSAPSSVAAECWCRRT